MGEPRAAILIVDDEDSIRDMLSRRLGSESYDCVQAANGEEAIWRAFVQDFDLVLLDMMMPGMSGMEVLSEIARDHPDTSVVMLTGVDNIEAAVEAMKLGAYDYVTKPFDLDGLMMRVEKALERRRLSLENKEYRRSLEQKVEQQVGQVQQYYREAIQALAREEIALNTLQTERSVFTEGGSGPESVYLGMARLLAQIAERHEPHARGHSERVDIVANQIATQIGCSAGLVRNLNLASIVHDIGKIEIPDHILFKPDHLTPAEYTEVKRHPTAAVEMLRAVDYFADILPIIESHHEWFNGKGYPNRLVGEQIPLAARILAVADAYDALTCPRPYRPRLASDEAVAVLKKGAGKQWDPEIVDALIMVLKQESRALHSPALGP